MCRGRAPGAPTRRAGQVRAAGGLAVEADRLDPGRERRLLAVGNASPAQGGFPLPSYTNWRFGVAFELDDHIKLDLSYFDTSLSREDCFVFTGDTMATPAGIPNPISNPGGLQSRLCGASFVATLSGKFDLSDLKK